MSENKCYQEICINVKIRTGKTAVRGKKDGRVVSELGGVKD